VAKRDGSSTQGNVTHLGSVPLLPSDAALMKRMGEVFGGADKPMRAFGICLMNMVLKKRKDEVVQPKVPKHPEPIHFDF